MSLRLLLCVALLLAIPALAQPSATPATPAQPAAQPDSPVRQLRVECKPAERASELIGKHGCVAGKVSRVTTLKSGDTHIFLCPSRSDCSFHAVAFARDRDKVGDLTYLHGKLIAIIGDVTEYRGHPEIVVKDAEQLRVAAVNPPPKFDAAQERPGKGVPAGKRGRAW